MPCVKGPTSWKPGQSGNPRGRPAGSRDRLTSAFVSKLADDFAEHGEQAIRDCRRDDPTAYLRLIVALAPKELEIRHDNALEQFSDAELAALLAAASRMEEKRDIAVDNARGDGGSAGGKAVH